MNNYIEMFKLGFIAIFAIAVFPVSLFGYVVSFLSKRRPCMTLAYWKRVFNIG